MSNIIELIVQIAINLVAIAILAFIVQWITAKFTETQLDYWTTFVILITAAIVTTLINSLTLTLMGKM